MARHIYESGIIGNCGFLAHVHKSTNISWLCWPRFDSSFIFGSLLDTGKGGGVFHSASMRIFLHTTLH